MIKPLFFFDQSLFFLGVSQFRWTNRHRSSHDPLVQELQREFRPEVFSELCTWKLDDTAPFFNTFWLWPFLRGGPVEDVEDSVAKRNNIIFHRGHGAPGEEADLVLMHTDDAWHIENCDPLWHWRIWQQMVRIPPPNIKNIVASHHSNKMSQVPSTSYSCVYIYTYIFMNLHLHIYIYVYMYGKMLSTGPRMSRRTIFGSWVRFGRCSRPSTSMGWQRCTPPKHSLRWGLPPNSVLLGANEGSWNSWKWKLWRPDQCETLWKSKSNARMMKTKTSSVSL